MGARKDPPGRVVLPAFGDAVRYDGGHARDACLTDTLGPFVEWVPVGPEVALELRLRNRV